MAIDIQRERVYPFSALTKLECVPRRRAGKKLNVATLYRWADRGLRGIQLEYVMVGGSRCTSVEALQRFFDELTARVHNCPARLMLSQTTNPVVVDAELDAAGF